MLFEKITIIDENFEVNKDMYVAVEGDTISYIGKVMPEKDFGESYNGQGKVLMPGFYNGHAHSPMALMRGYGENLVLQEWLTKKIFPFEAKLTGNAVYWGTMLCMAESLKFGIVSTSDMYYFVPNMVEAVAQCHGKNNISRSITNMSGESFDSLESVQEMKEAVELYNGYNNGKIIIDTSLHGEYTSDEPTARALAEFTKEAGLIMHVHVSETELEHQECKARHGGLTPVEYLNKCGIFDGPSIAAHCVHIEENDYNILKEKGVTVASNPVSNLKLASGVCNVPKLLDKGINVAIGTDSVASNNSLNFIEEMKTFALLGKVKTGDPTVITAKEALYAATRGGAIGQGRNNCGLIKEGYKADLIVMDINSPNMHPVHNLINNLVYSASSGDIIMTMVDGEILYDNGEYKTIDIEKTIFNVEKNTDMILKQI